MIDRKKFGYKLTQEAMRFAKSKGNICVYAKNSTVQGFYKGAYFGIDEFKKSLWHDASEEPKKGELCLVYGRYVYEGVSRMDYVAYTWLEDCDYVPQGDNYTIIRWCYLSDILPKEGGER